jgi:hypothetical protein
LQVAVGGDVFVAHGESYEIKVIVASQSSL